MSDRDYSPAEIEAIEFLHAGSLLDDWCSFVTVGADDFFRSVCPEQAAVLDEMSKRHRRMLRACRRLLARGLVEKGRCPIDQRCVAYRLIPMLRRERPVEVEESDDPR